MSSQHTGLEGTVQTQAPAMRVAFLHIHLSAQLSLENHATVSGITSLNDRKCLKTTYMREKPNTQLRLPGAKLIIQVNGWPDCPAGGGVGRSLGGLSSFVYSLCAQTHTQHKCMWYMSMCVFQLPQDDCMCL